MINLREFQCRHTCCSSNHGLPLDFTLYINVLISFSSCIFVLSSSFCHIYLWKHQCSSRSWTVLYIFLTSVWKPILWVDQQVTISTNLFILFFPFSMILLRLIPEVVGWDASIKYKTAWCAYWVAISNCSPRYEILNWILFQHFLLFWCQVFNKFHMSKTLQLGFWLYYIFFILWVLIQLFHLTIVDAKRFVFVRSKFMQRIKYQWKQFSCYCPISVNCDRFVNDILFHFFLETHHSCSWMLLASLTTSEIVVSVRNFTSCILHFFKHLKVYDQHVALWRFHTFAYTIQFIYILFTDHNIIETRPLDFHM